MSARPTSSKPGRPSKPRLEARTELVALRLTVDERDHVQRQAQRAGLPFSTYCRQVILRRKVPAAITETDAAALADLNRIGVNLNQIAKRLNAKGVTPATLDQVLAEVRVAIERLAERER